MESQVSGVTFSFDAAKPANARIDETTVKQGGPGGELGNSPHSEDFVWSLLIEQRIYFLLPWCLKIVDHYIVGLSSAT